jgi:hypothetical protein
MVPRENVPLAGVSYQADQSSNEGIGNGKPKGCMAQYDSPLLEYSRQSRLLALMGMNKKK